MNTITLTQLQQFRAALYHTFMHRADAVFELMDALAGDTQARTPVELSLSPLFQRQYPSIYDGLDGWRYDEPAVKEWLLHVASRLEHGDFRLIGVDHTPKPRPYANRVADRSVAGVPRLTVWLSGGRRDGACRARQANYRAACISSSVR
jgi:hypothetical protein